MCVLGGIHLRLTLVAHPDHSRHVAEVWASFPNHLRRGTTNTRRSQFGFGRIPRKLDTCHDGPSSVRSEAMAPLSGALATGGDPAEGLDLILALNKQVQLAANRRFDEPHPRGFRAPSAPSAAPEERTLSQHPNVLVG